jgi:hypothetical protein
MCRHLIRSREVRRIISFLRFQAIEYDNKFFVNPGTATGAWTGAFNGHVFLFYFQRRPFLIEFAAATPFLPLH